MRSAPCLSGRTAISLPWHRAPAFGESRADHPPESGWRRPLRSRRHPPTRASAAPNRIATRQPPAKTRVQTFSTRSSWARLGCYRRPLCQPCHPSPLGIPGTAPLAYRRIAIARVGLIIAGERGPDLHEESGHGRVWGSPQAKRSQSPMKDRVLVLRISDTQRHDGRSQVSIGVRPPSWHRLGPRDMSFEAKGSRHVAVAIPEVRVSRGIAVSPRQ